MIQIYAPLNLRYFTLCFCISLHSSVNSPKFKHKIRKSGRDVDAAFEPQLIDETHVADRTSVSNQTDFSRSIQRFIVQVGVYRVNACRD